jgi:UDP-3-O-[3-hydroxymyristoyl] glucosamine N-acyltransferase
MTKKLQRSLKLKEILDNYSEHIGEVLGVKDIEVTEVCHPNKSNQQAISFVTNPKFLAESLKSEKAILVVSQGSVTQELPLTIKTLILSPNPEWLMAELFNDFILKTPYKNEDFKGGIHPQAIVHPEAKLGDGVQVGPNAFVGAQAIIGNEVHIGANAIVENGAEIGDNSCIHPLAYIGHHCILGKNVEVQPSAVIGAEGYGYAHDRKGEHRRIPHLGIVRIGDNAHIGANCAIDRATLEETVIGEGTRLDNQCHIAHNCIIGKNCLITAQFVVAGSAKIGDNFICGGKTVVAGHKTITDNVNFAAMSVAANDVKEPGRYGGYPLQPLNQYLKTTATRGHLVEMRKNINKLMKAVFE